VVWSVNRLQSVEAEAPPHTLSDRANRLIDYDFVDSFRRPATQNNWVRDFNPITLLLVLLSISIIAVAVPNLVAPLLACASYVVIAFLARVGKQFVLTYAKLFVVVGLLLFVLRALFIPGKHTLFALGTLKISAEGVTDGLRFALMIMALCGAVALYFALVPMKLLMGALEDRGVSPHATYVILASFQAIVDLSKNTTVVMEAQKSRGIETEGSILNRALAFLPVLTPVLLSSMSSTEERAMALDARAFNASGEHTHLVSLRKVPGSEIAVGCAALLAVLVSIVGRMLSWF